jgi:GH24 family phage-related lysozyme (muramidase)
MSKRLHGADAVAKARELLGRPLSASEAHIASVEGYSLETYDDTKGVKTVGFGQTGEFAGMPFDEVVSSFENRTRGVIPAYDSLPEALQLRLLDSTYRGGISGSEKTLGHVNAGRWQEAATEFLDHGDFRRSQAGNGAIAERMQSTSDAMKNYGETLYEEAQVRKEQSSSIPMTTEGVPQVASEAIPQADAGFLDPVDDFFSNLFGGDKSGKPKKEVTEMVPKAHKDIFTSFWDAMTGD